jgi:hypothetical protein
MRSTGQPAAESNMKGIFHTFTSFTPANMQQGNEGSHKILSLTKYVEYVKMQSRFMEIRVKQVKNLLNCFIKQNGMANHAVAA